jgi:glycosyltransferase involved in cell wall biosynthesis
LLVRDDGSTDCTPELLARHARKDQRIEILDNHPALNLGPRGSFGLLIEHARAVGARYACFCDQDDVWHPEKIDWEISAAKELERRQGENHPILVYTDLEIVDRDLGTVNESFYAYQAIKRGADEPPFTTLLAQNHVAGCTVMMNASLLELASPIPEEAYMHDWWVALCARACGSMQFLPQATVKYRQHRGNQVGAGGLRRLRRIGAWRAAFRKMNRIFLQSIAQAGALVVRLQNWGDDSRRDCVEHPQLLGYAVTWSRLRETKLPVRVNSAWSCRLRSHNLPLTALLYLQLLTLSFQKKH